MARMIDQPPRFETVEDVRRYLYQLAQELTDALNELERMIQEKGEK